MTDRQVVFVCIKTVRDGEKVSHVTPDLDAAIRWVNAAPSLRRFETSVLS